MECSSCCQYYVNAKPGSAFTCGECQYVNDADACKVRALAVYVWPIG
jgi:transposase